MMKVVIIEDEVYNAKLLQGMIQELRPEWEILTILDSVISSVDWFNSNTQPDLIFIDIQLTDGISFSIFEEVEIESPVIFTTAFDEYAIQAFKVNSIDYLLKPIKKELLATAINKFENWHIGEKTDKPDYQMILKSISEGKKEYRERFLIAGAVSYTKLYVKDIAYFYAENRMTFAVCFNGDEHILNHTIEKLEEELDPKYFFRLRRSHIVHIDSIQKFDNYFGGKLIVNLIKPFNHNITVSRLKATDFKNWVDS